MNDETCEHGIERPCFYCDWPAMAQRAADAILAAVAEEREACAVASLNARPHAGKPCGCGECLGAESAAAAIRARGTP